VDALVLGSVTLYNEATWGVVKVPVDNETREPVMASRTTQVEKDGKMVSVQENYVADYNVTHERSVIPQTYRIEAEVGVVVKMVDTQTGEIVWVGSDTEEGPMFKQPRNIPRYNHESPSQSLADQRQAAPLKRNLPSRQTVI